MDARSDESAPRAGTGARGRGRPRRRRPGRRQTGRSIAARWTRIWCVRPVSSRTPSSARSPSGSRSSNQVTASRGVSVSSEWRVRSVRSRPIGASMRPVRERGPPSTSATYRALDLAPADRVLQRAVRRCRARDDEQAGGVAVEPVDDARPVGLAPRPRRRAPAGRGRACRAVAGRRMDDEAGGLVDDEQVLVLPGDPELHRLGLELLVDAASGSATATSSPPSSLWLFGSAPAADEHRARRRAAVPRPRASRSRAARRARGRAARPAASQERESGASPRRGRRRGPVGGHERGEQDADADDDERVGEVEGRPPAQVEEVRDVPEPHAVEQVRDAAAEHEAERDGQHRVALAGAGEEGEHPRTARAVARITIDVDCEKSPKAMPVFCTWCRDSGPATCTSSPSDSAVGHDVLRQLVGGDRRERDGAERGPLVRARRPATARRSRSAAARSSTSRRGRRAGGAAPGCPGVRARVIQRSSCARPRCRGSCTGTASSRSSSIWRAADLAACRTCRRRCASSAASIPPRRRPRPPPGPRRTRGRTCRVAVSARWLSALEETSSPVSSSSESDVVPVLDDGEHAGTALLEVGAEARRCRWPSTLLPAGHGQPSVDLVGSDPGQLDDLVARGASRDDVDA